jgi:hypothetical protein
MIYKELAAIIDSNSSIDPKLNVRLRIREIPGI